MQKKLDYIDAIRCFAILMVIMVHTAQFGITQVSDFFNIFTQQGARGVQLFYIASAFTLFYSFDYRKDKEKSPNRNFFIRRLFRIAPLFYLAIIYYLFQDGLGSRYWLGDAIEVSKLNILSNALFLNGFYPYWINSIVPGSWSISVEMIFYFCLPFIFLKIKNINHAFLFFTSSLLLLICLHWYFVSHVLISDKRLWFEYLYFYFPSQLPVFGLGIILYFLTIKKEKLSQIKPIYLLQLAFVISLHFVYKRIPLIPNHIVYGIAFMFIVLLIEKFQPKVLVNRLTIFIGNISFGLYLVHFAVLHLLLKLDLANLLGTGLTNYLFRYFCVICISIPVASVLFKFIEQPMQKLGKKWIQKLEA